MVTESTSIRPSASRSVGTVIIGGGQAGLAMSRHLKDCGITSQVIFERGQVAERWRSSYWDSLHLLTPNWQLRLPGSWRYMGDDVDAFMTKGEFVQYLQDYAESFDAPIQTNTEVIKVEEYNDETDAIRFQVTTRETKGNSTTQTIWFARNVVIATGFCDQPKIPDKANSLPSNYVWQISAADYKNPAQVLSFFDKQATEDSLILTVGAGASGVQTAHELAEAVHDSDASPRVMISVGRHCRWPRNYRGRDILWRIDQMGAFRAQANQKEESSSPGPQLSGGQTDSSLYQLHQQWGVEIVGKMLVNNNCLEFDNLSLGACLKQADDGCIELLSAIDGFIERKGLNPSNTPNLTDRPVDLCPRLSYEELSTQTTNISFPTEQDGNDNGATSQPRVCIIWSTGFTRHYSYLSEPLHDKLWDKEHCILHNTGGITAQLGLYVLGYRWQRRKHSNFIDGVGEDAAELASHIANQDAGRLRCW